MGFTKLSFKDFFLNIKTSFLPTSTNKIKTDRILYLDFVKFFAAFFTVFYHLAYYKLDYGFSQDTVYYPNFSRIVMCFASCCVPLFFMVNGALMFARHRTIKDTYLKILKIAFLIIFWSFLNFPSWFFKTLCVLYLLFPIFQYIYNHSKKWYFVICGLVLVFPYIYNFAVMMIQFVGLKEINLIGISISLSSFRRTGFFTLYSILYYLLGPVISKVKKTPIYLDLILIFSGLFLVVLECTIYTNLNNVMFDGVNAAFPTLGALLLSVGLFLFFKKFTFKAIKKPLLFICNGIFAIYILHSYIIYILPSVVSETLIGSIIVAFAICLVGATVGKLASKIPIVCWFFKI